MPVAGSQVGLLGELALRGGKRLLTVDVEESCGWLPQVVPHRVPVLAHQKEPILLIERDDADRTRVHKNLPGDGLPVLEPDVVAADVPHQAVEHRLGGDDLQLGLLVSDRPAVRSPHQVMAADAAAASTGAACSRFASAAAIRPANSGWARAGRDRNSGCACVATK